MYHIQMRTREATIQHGNQNYETRELNAKLAVSKDQYKAALGVSKLEANRKNPLGDKTSKDNQAIFVTSLYNVNKNLNVSAGLRKELVDYTHKPNAGSAISDDHSLTAVELGANYKLGDKSSVFVNYSQGYQAPNIDRFFSGGSFNAFIDPSKVKTHECRI